MSALYTTRYEIERIDNGHGTARWSLVSRPVAGGSSSIGLYVTRSQAISEAERRARQHDSIILIRRLK